MQRGLGGVRQQRPEIGIDPVVGDNATLSMPDRCGRQCHGRTVQADVGYRQSRNHYVASLPDVVKLVAKALEHAEEVGNGRLDSSAPDHRRSVAKHEGAIGVEKRSNIFPEVGLAITPAFRLSRTRPTIDDKCPSPFLTTLGAKNDDARCRKCAFLHTLKFNYAH